MIASWKIARSWCNKKPNWVSLLILRNAKTCEQLVGFFYLRVFRRLGFTLHHSLKPPTPRGKEKFNGEGSRARRGEQKSHKIRANRRKRGKNLGLMTYTKQPLRKSIKTQRKSKNHILHIRHSASNSRNDRRRMGQTKKRWKIIFYCRVNTFQKTFVSTSTRCSEVLRGISEENFEASFYEKIFEIIFLPRKSINLNEHLMFLGA